MKLAAVFFQAKACLEGGYIGKETTIKSNPRIPISYIGISCESAKAKKICCEGAREGRLFFSRHHQNGVRQDTRKACAENRFLCSWHQCVPPISSIIYTLPSTLCYLWCKSSQTVSNINKCILKNSIRITLYLRAGEGPLSCRVCVSLSRTAQTIAATTYVVRRRRLDRIIINIVCVPSSFLSCVWIGCCFYIMFTCIMRAKEKYADDPRG